MGILVGNVTVTVEHVTLCKRLSYCIAVVATSTIDALLKGNESPDGYFSKAYKIKPVLSVHAQMVFKYLVYLLEEKSNIKFLLASLKTLTDSKDCSESRIRMFPLPCLSLVDFLRYTLMDGCRDHRRLSEQLQRHRQTASGKPEQFLESDTGRIYTIRSDFIEASRNFTKRQP
jgi:hypothetical protein